MTSETGLAKRGKAVVWEGGETEGKSGVPNQGNRGWSERTE
jgi:hypothetical protein